MRVTHGRTPITTTVRDIGASNIAAVFRDALMVHTANASDIEYLYRYYKGHQPILQRIKQVREEINNRIVENHAQEIVSFYRGYSFGEPIKYVQRNGTEADSENINLLNDYMIADSKATKDQFLAEWFFICGVAYRLVLPHRAMFEDEAPFKTTVLDPRQTFVVRSTGIDSEPVLGVTFYKGADERTVYCAYTKTHYYELVDDRVVKAEPHALGMIPIIEYPANSVRMGAFEPALPLLDAINTLASNRMDGVEQFIQSFIKFVNCEIDEERFQSMKALGAIMVKGQQGLTAEVDIVTSELNQNQTQILKDDLYQMVLIICGMPDRNGANRTTGDTGQAVILRDGWSAAETRARDVETIYKQSEREFLRLALRIARDLSGMTLSLRNIDIKFTRNMSDSLLVKTQGMQNLLEAGVHPRIAIATVGLFSDPQMVYDESQEHLEKWKEKEAGYTPGNNKSFGGEPDVGGSEM